MIAVLSFSLLDFRIPFSCVRGSTTRRRLVPTLGCAATDTAPAHFSATSLRPQEGTPPESSPADIAHDTGSWEEHTIQRQLTSKFSILFYSADYYYFSAFISYFIVIVIIIISLSSRSFLYHTDWGDSPQRVVPANAFGDTPSNRSCFIFILFQRRISHSPTNRNRVVLAAVAAMEEEHEAPRGRRSPQVVRIREEQKPEHSCHAQLLIGYLEGQCQEYRAREEEALARGEQRQQDISLFHSMQVPSLSIHDYVIRIARYASCSPECFVIALLLIHRYQYFTRMTLSLRNAHRLVITAVLVSTKSRDDIFFSNDYFSSIGGLQPKEMGALERRFLDDIQWSTYVDWAEYQSCLVELQKRMPQYFDDACAEEEEAGAASVVSTRAKQRGRTTATVTQATDTRKKKNNKRTNKQTNNNNNNNKQQQPGKIVFVLSEAWVQTYNLISPKKPKNKQTTTNKQTNNNKNAPSLPAQFIFFPSLLYIYIMCDATTCGMYTDLCQPWRAAHYSDPGDDKRKLVEEINLYITALLDEVYSYRFIWIPYTYILIYKYRVPNLYRIMPNNKVDPRPTFFIRSTA
eukprot:gene13334-9167_t